MNTSWSIDNNQYQLFRYPPNQHDKSLQGWDSSDELVVQYVNERYSDASSLPTTVIYDDLFGAISIGLNRFGPICVLDSYVSQLAIEHNHEINQLVRPPIYSSLDIVPNCNLAIVKITKNIAYLEHQLQTISAQSINCDVIATGKTTLITTAVMKLFERYFANVKSSLAKRKSRLIFATHSASHNQSQATVDNARSVNAQPNFTAHWPDKKLTLSAYANVFSKDQIDIGGRFLVDHLPYLEATEEPFTAIDLGCGNGLVGLSLLQQNESLFLNPSTKNDQPKNRIIFCDESHMAIASAQYNVQQNVPLLSQATLFVQDDCLSQQATNSADLILCNPPFHQQNAITTHIAQQMINQAAQVLKKQGVLYLVANRHLPYQSMLKTTFGGFTILASNAKFVIYQCKK